MPSELHASTYEKSPKPSIGAADAHAPATTEDVVKRPGVSSGSETAPRAASAPRTAAARSAVVCSRRASERPRSSSGGRYACMQSEIASPKGQKSQ